MKRIELGIGENGFGRVLQLTDFGATYQSGNDTVELQFSSNYWKGQTYYHMTSASATTTDASGNKISDSVPQWRFLYI